MLNNPNAQGAVRTPRLRILLIDGGVAGQTNGGTGAAFVPPPINAPLNGAVSAGVTNNNYYQADTFEALFKITTKADLQFWSSQPRAVVDIQISLDGQTWVSMLVGEVDQVTVLPFSGEVTVNGRDLTARFIEAKTQETFANQTSSQVAATLAARHGLKTAITPTTTLVSRFYQDDHTMISLGQFSRSTTEWDLLIDLARHEGFDCYVSGQTLHFGPRTDPGSNPWVIQCDPYTTPMACNVIDPRFERSLTLARDIEVAVRSWDSRNQRGFTKIARAIGAKGAQAAGAAKSNGLDVQRYYVVLPNLTETQAQAKANTILSEISKHERVLTFHAPGDLILSPRVMVLVQGTQTEFDQVYFVDRVTRRISVTEGFSMDARCKNRSTESYPFAQQTSADTANYSDAPVSYTTQTPAEQAGVNPDIDAALTKRFNLGY